MIIMCEMIIVVKLAPILKDCRENGEYIYASVLQDAGSLESGVR